MLSTQHLQQRDMSGCMFPTHVVRQGSYPLQPQALGIILHRVSELGSLAIIQLLILLELAQARA